MAITQPLTQTTNSRDATSNATSITATYPSSILEDDFLLLAVCIRTISGTPSITTPSGWTVISHVNASTVARGLYYRRADGTETGTFSVSHTGSWTASVAVDAFRGVDWVTGPFDVAASTGTSATLASITTVTDGAWRVDALHSTTNSAVTPHANQTERWDLGASGGGSATHRNWGAVEEIDTAGSTGTRAITASGTLRTVTFALMPAAAGGGLAARKALLGAGR